MPQVDWLALIFSLFVILLGAELFTNGVEWIGEGFGLSEGMVGSVLAAVGTALPETLLPLVAILSGHATGDEIGTGAILGAPFMLTTLAMVVVAVSVLVASRGGRRGLELRIDTRVIGQDLAYFLAMYTLALIAGLVHIRSLHVVLSIGLLLGYVYYVRRHLLAEDGGPSEGSGEIKPLELWDLLGRFRREQGPWSVDRSTALPFVQTGVALAVIVGGADLFVSAVDSIGSSVGLSPLAFSLLVAPLATELPEKFNSIIWIRRGKDTLAMGNMTGAMVFQASFPVTVGLLLTDWKLDQTGLVAAITALVAGTVIWSTLRLRGRLTAPLLLLQGVFYLGYVGYVLKRI
jgi:cation:H+ antiporter